MPCEALLKHARVWRIGQWRLHISSSTRISTAVSSAKLCAVRARINRSISHILFLLLPAPALLFAQAGNQSTLHLDTGEHIFKSACIACHGPDGKGTPET